MNIVYADEFVKQFRKLPRNVQNGFRGQERIFKKNWCDSRLHTKKLKGAPQVFSFRITRAYRALFVFVEQNTVLLASIGHRKDIYR